MRKHVAIPLALAGALSASSVSRADEAQVGPEVITVVVVGDVGLNRSNLEVDSRGVKEGKGVLAWSKMTAGIKGLINGDLNFMNLETVVTDRNDLAPGDKGQKTPYLFRSHPDGIEHLADAGFNLISAANNHAYDYGEDGVRETVKHLSALAKKKRIHWSGVGIDKKQAAAPARLNFRGARVAFSSVGIVTNMIKAHRATDSKPGSMSYRYAEDWELVTDNLGKAPADIRLLSVHYGKERQIRSEKKQLDDYRWATREKKVDIVIGHHAHVVRGIEMHNGKLIFYGLGNFLIRGARDMGSDPRLKIWGDFGLYGKAYLVRQPDGRYLARAVEIVPVIDMHRSPRRYPDTAESKRRVEVLNVLATKLDDKKAGSVGLRFTPREDGSGLHCVSGAARDPEPVASLCRGWKAPGAPSADIARAVGAKLGGGGKAKPRSKKKRRKR